MPLSTAPVNATMDAANRASRGDRWPAILDLTQSVSGALLVLFISVHLLLDSAILISPRAADRVARFFEGEALMGKAHPWLVSIAAALLLLLVMLHAVLALRKFPHDYRQYRALTAQAPGLRHSDTRLWVWQVITGLLLFFLATPHLVQMITQPDAIGALPSSLRVVEQRAWILYIVFLPVLLLHGGAGTYRLTMKWWSPSQGTPHLRANARLVVWIITGVYLLLGSATLIAYVRQGLMLNSS